ncbi:MAG: Sec-independent protein translocase protein TatB [Sulfuricella denitrificans]|nr:Sec-independent protein translocase protein TatB [Sulfuricella denitrificans]
MFDFGFSELLLIGVVALVVIGPERLPKVARTAGHLFGRLQRYVADVKADINREIQVEELKKLQEEMHASVNSIENAVKRDMQAGSEALSKATEQIHEIVELPRQPESVSEPLPETPIAVEEPQPQLELDLGTPDQLDAELVQAEIKDDKHV